MKLKRIYATVVATAMVTSLCACGEESVSKTEYDNLQSEYEALQSDYNDLKGDYLDLEEEYNNLSEYFDLIVEQYQYGVEEDDKTKDVDYSLTAKAVFRADITYGDLMKTADEYEGVHFVMTGEIIQVIEGDEYTCYRVAINGNYDEVILLEVENENNAEELLEYENITFYAISCNTYTYESTTGNYITIPAALAYIIEKVNDTSAASNETTSTVSEYTNAALETLAEYSLETSYGSTYHFMIVKNTSDVTVDVSSCSTAYNSKGDTISTAEANIDALGAGCTSILCETFEVETIDRYETTLTTTEPNFFKSILQDLSYTQTMVTGGVTIEVTNNGENPAELVEGYALFFKNGNIVGWSSDYFAHDDTCEIRAGETVTKTLYSWTIPYEEFDTVEFYMTGVRFY